MDDNDLIALLQELISARGPSGQEDEVRDICRRELSRFCDRVWIDGALNVVGQLAASSGRVAQGESPAIRVMAHMDELAMMVRRVEPDATLKVTNLGGIRPGSIGQGPVDILGDGAVIPGVLSLGPQHLDKPEKKETWATSWTDVHIFTNKTADELRNLGVHPGTRVVISRERRKLLELGDSVGGYFMDDRAPVAALVAAAALVKERHNRLGQDVYFVMTTEEELDGGGGAFASRTLPGDVTIAVEVGPISGEYGTVFRKDPIIAYGDSRGLYSKTLADALVRTARDIGQNPQTAVWENFCSDASLSKAFGQAGRSGLISIPTLNTHGYEIIARGGISACAELLAAFLCRPL